MNHEQFVANIEPWLDGVLDFVQAAEFHEHSRSCRECSRRASTVFFNRWENNDSHAEQPQVLACLTDDTLSRWASEDMSDDLMDLAEHHLEQCRSCAERANNAIDRLCRSDHPPADTASIISLVEGADVSRYSGRAIQANVRAFTKDSSSSIPSRLAAASANLVASEAEHTTDGVLLCFQSEGVDYVVSEDCVTSHLIISPPLPADCTAISFGDMLWPVHCEPACCFSTVEGLGLFTLIERYSEWLSAPEDKVVTLHFRPVEGSSK